MAEWAEGEHRDAGEADELHLSIAGTNARQQAVARALGYAPTGGADIRLNHQRPDALPEMPDIDINARPVRLDDADEVAARVALLREVRDPSRFTEDGYARLRTKPVYRPDLDLVAVMPEEELAA